MIALSVAKLNFFSPDSDISLWIKAKKKKKLFVESLDQFRRLEVREKARNVFVMSLRLSDHKVLITQHRIFIKFFRFRSDFLSFLARISYFQIFGVLISNRPILNNLSLFLIVVVQ